MIELLNWDMLLMLGELLTLVGPVIILRNREAFVPRFSSGSLVVALTLMVIALYGLGAPIGATATAVVVASWIAVFVLRGRKQ